MNSTQRRENTVTVKLSLENLGIRHVPLLPSNNKRRKLLITKILENNIANGTVPASEYAQRMANIESVYPLDDVRVRLALTANPQPASGEASRRSPATPPMPLD